MSNLPEAVVERIQSEVAKVTGSTLGVIAAISLPTATVTVTLAGSAVAGVRCAAGYFPTVGDLVTVERVRDQLIASSKISKNLTAPPIPSLGTIAAINLAAATVSVSQASGTVTGALCLTGYYPTVGDVVVLERIKDQWVVQGRISRNLTAPSPAGPDPTPTPTPDPNLAPTPAPVLTTASVTVTPQAVYRADFQTSMPGENVTWNWSPTAGAAQGRQEVTDGVYALRDDYGALAQIVLPIFPAGATITSAKMGLARLATSGLALVSPTIFGHTLTGTTPTGSIASYLHASYGPWSPGSLAKGQGGVWDLPSGWIAALMAGTLKGFGVWDGTLAKRCNFDAATFCQLTITYTYTP